MSRASAIEGAAAGPVATLLYVDDNVTLARFSALNLEESIPDLRVLVAATCAEARQLTAGHTLDVLVVDRLLPDGNGLALRRELEATQPAIRSILVCATPPSRDAPEAADFFRVIRKPFNSDDLVQTVVEAMSRSDRETTTERAAEETAENDGFDRHRVINRLSSLLAKLRAFEGELHAETEASPPVVRLTEAYIPTLIRTIHEVAAMVRRPEDS